MREKVLGLAIAAGMLASAVQPLTAQADSSAGIHVYVDDKELNVDQPPVIQNNFTLVPLRGVVEALGAQVNWNQNTQAININMGNKSINIKIGSYIALVNGAPVPMDTKAVVLNNSTLVPLRFISENLGDNVIWDGKTNSVYISKKQNDPYLSALEQLIKQHMENRDSLFSIPIQNQGKGLDSAITDVLNQDDYLRNDYTQCNFDDSYDENGNGNANFHINYLEEKDQNDFVNQKVKQILNTIITPEMNDYQKEKAVHDYIILHVAYDTTEDTHSAYDALAKGVTVCQGYALLTYKMLTDLGIPAKIVTGYANNQLHAWNMVYIEGHWYHLDTTFDDPVPDVNGRVFYNYFNLTDDQIKHDHTWTQDTSIPTAKTEFSKVLETQVVSDPNRADFYNSLLFAINATVSTANNVQDLQKVLQDALSNNITKISIKYKASSDTELNDALNKATSSIKFYGTVNYKSTYMTDTRDNNFYDLTFDISYN